MQWVLIAAVLASLAGCVGGDGRSAAEPGTAEASQTSTTAVVDGPPFDVDPGVAVVLAGDVRYEFVVFECLVGDETGSPVRRLALSASDTEPFLEADRFLSVDILVSQVIDGHEEHVISIFDADGSFDVGAADLATPSRGGPAPDDWIEHDPLAHVVYGEGFELRSTTLDDDTVLTDGVLVADCPGSQPG